MTQAATPPQSPPRTATNDPVTSTFTITVETLNEAPQIAAVDPVTVEETQTATASISATDAESDPLTVSSVQGDPANVGAAVATAQGGTVTVNADGSFAYTPKAGFDGTDTFTYKASDGKSDSNVATVTMTVNPNNAPVAQDDPAYTTNQDTALNTAAPGVLDNDTDAESDPLTVSSVQGDPANVGAAVATAQGGTVTVNADGSFAYTPKAGFDGTDTFTYKASDGKSDSNVATVTITVNPNNAPVAQDDPAYTTDQDTALTTAAPGVLDNDTDAESDPLTLSLTLTDDSDSSTVDPANYTFTDNGDGTASFEWVTVVG